jgi:hypothetical protein
MTQQQNAWTKQEPPGAALPQSLGVAAPPPVPGVPAQPGVVPPPAHERLPKFAIAAADTIWWLGVHGGSGESTMAQLLPGSRAAGHRWPIPPPPVPTPTVLVARTNAHGLRAAQRAAAEWSSGAVQGVVVLGLVLIADAPGRLPRVLDDFADIVGGSVPRVWDIPWIEEWRRGEEPNPQNTPDEVFEVLESVYALHGPGPSSAPTNY